MDMMDLGRSEKSEPGQMMKVDSIRQRLDLAVKQAENRLIQIKRAKELFDKNPDLEELLNIMQSAYF